jgi:alpha-L-fucosidase
VYGEGPPDVVTGRFNEKTQRPYTAEDIRFTQKGETLYAFALGWPASGKLTIKTLAQGATALPKPVQRVDLIGVGPVTFAQTPDGLVLTLPEKAPNPYAYGFVVRT